MEQEKHIQFLQLAYTGVLADALSQFATEGVLENVTARKREVSLAAGKTRLGQYGVSQPEEVFMKLAELFGCANWELTDNADGFTARTNTCTLCGIAKKIGAPQPCHMYCLDPMEGMVKAFDEVTNYSVEETLWDSSKCTIRVEQK